MDTTANGVEGDTARLKSDMEIIPLSFLMIKTAS